MPVEGRGHAQWPTAGFMPPPRPECAELGPPLMEAQMGDVAWGCADSRWVARGTVQRGPVAQESFCLLPL